MFRHKDASNNSVMQTWQPSAVTSVNPSPESLTEWESIARELARFVTSSATKYWARSEDYVLADIRRKLKE